MRELCLLSLGAFIQPPALRVVPDCYDLYTEGDFFMHQEALPQLLDGIGSAP